MKCVEVATCARRVHSTSRTVHEGIQGSDEQSLESLDKVDTEKTRVFCSYRSHYAALGLHVSDVSHLPSACLNLIEVNVM